MRIVALVLLTASLVAATVALTLLMSQPGVSKTQIEAVRLADDSVTELQACVRTAREATDTAETAVKVAERWEVRARRAEAAAGGFVVVPNN